MVERVLEQYRMAARRLWPNLAIHLAVRLIGVAVLLPVAAFAIRWMLHRAGRSAITDKDIVWFFFTFPGTLALLIAAALVIFATILDLALMSVAEAGGAVRAMTALELALGFAWRHPGRLLLFCLAFTLRMIWLAAPFVLGLLLLPRLGLRQHEMAYYLVETPPEFLIVAALAVLLVGLLAWQVIRRLSDWAIAPWLALSGRSPVLGSFAESERLVAGRAADLRGRIAVWAGSKLLLVLTVSAAMAWLTGTIPNLFGAELQLAAWTVLVLLVAWAALAALVAALTNGALAGLLQAEFAETTGRLFSTAEPDRIEASGVRLVLVTAALLVVGGAVLVRHLVPTFTQSPVITIIAHRGASALAPENTMAAVRQAIADRADWIQVDVQEDGDGEVVVVHDSDFLRVAHLPLMVWQARQADLDAIDIGSWFERDFSNERTPDLRDVLELARDTGAKIMINLKYYGHDQRLEQGVAEVVDQTGMGHSIAVMSLDIAGINRMRALRPDWRSGVVAARSIGDLTGLDVDFLALNAGQVSLKQVWHAKSAGQQVYGWTADTPLAISRLIEQGVNGIITDDPAFARRVARAHNRLSLTQRLLLWTAGRLNLSSLRLAEPEDEA